MTLRETLEGLLSRARTDARKAELSEELAVPAMPMALQYLWDAFMRIRRRKGAGLNGPLPIEWPDIAAFVTLSGWRFAPWEIEIIEDLDSLWLSSIRGEN